MIGPKISFDLNKPFQGDLCKYYGITWIFFNDKWLPLEKAMEMKFLVSKDADTMRRGST